MHIYAYIQKIKIKLMAAMTTCALYICIHMYIYITYIYYTCVHIYIHTYLNIYIHTLMYI